MATNDRFLVRDRRPGFLRVYNDLYDRYGAQLGPYGLAVYVALCRYANEDSECWPSYGKIAKGTGMSKRKVIYEIQKMEALQIIAVERNQNTSNVFILLDTSAQHAPPPQCTWCTPPVHSMHLNKTQLTRDPMGLRTRQKQSRRTSAAPIFPKTSQTSCWVEAASYSRLMLLPIRKPSIRKPQLRRA